MNGLRISRTRAAIAFLSGSLSAFSFTLIGTLSGTDLLAIATFPFALLRFGSSYHQTVTTLLKLSLLGLISLGISDFLNNTADVDMLKGLANFVMFAILLIFFLEITDRQPVYFAYLFFGIGMSQLYSNPSIEMALAFDGSNYFKVQLASILQYTALGAMVLAATYGRHMLAWGVAIGACLIFALGGARSYALFFFVGFAVLLATKIFVNYGRTERILGLIIVAVTTYLAFLVYVSMVLSGAIASANTTAAIDRMSNPFNPIEFLFENRRDSFVPITLVLERPLWGYGSWAIARDDEVLWLADQIFEDRLVESGSFIPAHSVFMAAWLWGGLFCFLSVFGIAKTLTKVTALTYRRSKYSLSLLILTALLIWHLLFSPFGHIRTTVPLTAAFIVACSLQLVALSKRMSLAPPVKLMRYGFRLRVPPSDRAKPRFAYPFPVKSPRVPRGSDLDQQNST